MASSRTRNDAVGISRLMFGVARQLFGAIFFVLALQIATTGALSAQDASQVAIDYDRWEVVATRAETALADGRASSPAFEQLRETLVDYRAVFQAAQELRVARIETLSAQIEGLGAAPQEGETEARDIADRRAALTASLAQIEAPRKRAGEAYSRANGLIEEIDGLIRTRETDRLLELGPSPLNPNNWPKAISAFAVTVSAIAAEPANARETTSQSARFIGNVPVILGLLFGAVLMVFRVPKWIGLGASRFSHPTNPAGARLVGNLVALARVAALTLAALLLVRAIELTALVGFRGQIVLDVIPVAVFAISAARWVARWLVPESWGTSHGQAIVRVAGWLGAIWSLDEVLSRLAFFDAYSEQTTAVLHFPLILIAGFLMLQMARLLRVRPTSDVASEADGDPEPPKTDLGLRDRARRALSLLALVVAIAAPLAAAIGYGSLSVAVIFPAILTLAIFAGLAAASAMARDAYGLIRGKTDAEASESLTPILLNLAFAALSIPTLLVVWGMRPTRLWEIWNSFSEGVQIGETRISPTDFLTFAIVFVAGYILTRALQSTLRTSVLPKTQIDKGAQNSLISGLGYVGISLAAFIAISSAGVDLSSLAIVAGALSVGIGFGLQNIVSNFVSGIILLIERPISEGDWIEVGGNAGYVRDISVRSTRIETFDRSDVVVPNSDLVSGTVTNYTRGNLIGRVIVPVSVAYGTDTKRVAEILNEIARAHPMVTLNPAPSVLFVNLGADGLDFEIRAILRDVNWVMSVKSDMNHEIIARFAAEGIEVPFVQRDIWLRNPEALQALAGDSE